MDYTAITTITITITTTATTLTTYNIEKGLLEVEHLLPADPKNARFILGIILEWRGLMKSISLDEGCVVDYFTLDTYTMKEAMIDGSPLYEIRSIDQYLCWKALEAYTQDLYQQRFFDLCIEHERLARQEQKEARHVRASFCESMISSPLKRSFFLSQKDICGNTEKNRREDWRTVHQPD